MMRTRLPIFSTAIVLIVLFPSLLTPITASAQGERIPRIGGHTEGGGAVINGQYGDNESDPGTPSSGHNPADDIPRLTNSSDASPAAQTYGDAARCKNVYVNKAPNSRQCHRV